VTFFVFLFYITYHVISKVRDNEKNKKMNNLAIFLSFLGLVGYSIRLTDNATYLLITDKYYSWYDNHATKYWWI